MEYIYNWITKFWKELVIFTGKYMAWFVIYILPIHPFLITIYILIFFDLFTGIYKAITKKEKITSKRMRESVVKFVFYSIAVFISFQVDVTILSDSLLLLTKVVGGYIMYVEFASNIENISEITDKDIWKSVKDKVAAILTNKTDTKS